MGEMGSSGLGDFIESFVYESRNIRFFLLALDALAFRPGSSTAAYDVFRSSPIKDIASSIESALIACARPRIFFFLFDRIAYIMDDSKNKIFRAIMNIHRMYLHVLFERFPGLPLV
jgi:hypothetical protein